MAHLISFKTKRFDVSKESPNPVNPIAGQSVLSWLRDELVARQYQATGPDAEDWGWYLDVAGPGGTYLVGASADADGSGPVVEWIIQVHKSRSTTEKLLGRNKMMPDDALSALIERLVRSDTGIEDVSVEREP
jgi:hypothetical protein